MSRARMLKQAPRARASARGRRFALLRSLFNQRVGDGLVDGARGALLELGAVENDIVVFDVPGAFELPHAAQAAARSGAFDAVVALGAVIRGDTDHYEHVARECAAGLAAVGRETGVPVAFGVLTVREAAQAQRRAAPGPGNKGAEAARAAALLLDTLAAIRADSRERRRPARGRRGA